MKKYLEKAIGLQQSYSYFQLVRIPRGQNSQADTLSKIALSSTISLVEEVHKRSIKEAEVNIVANDEPN